MEKKEWQNHTTIGMLEPTRGLKDGKALHVPSFGPNGLVFILGGTTRAIANFKNTENPDPKLGPVQSFTNISFFDPASNRWYWQTTTGTAPNGRIGHCVVGARSSAGSYVM